MSSAFSRTWTSSIERRHVLVVEDIIDSGLTLSYLLRNLEAREPASLEVCALMTKPERRENDVECRYVGFEIPNRFVIGYGLDFAERYRNLPYVGVLRDELVAQAEEPSKDPRRVDRPAHLIEVPSGQTARPNRPDRAVGPGQLERRRGRSMPRESATSHASARNQLVVGPRVPPALRALGAFWIFSSDAIKERARTAEEETWGVRPATKLSKREPIPGRPGKPTAGCYR